MVDMCSSTTSFEDLAEEEVKSNTNLSLSNDQINEKNTSEKIDLDTFKDIHSLTNSECSNEDNWISLDNDEANGELNYKEKFKLSSIFKCLRRSDTDGLRELAISPYGLLNDSIRRLVWPKLAEADIIETSPRPTKDIMKSHPFYNQVVLDVKRSLTRFPPSIKENQKLSMQKALIQLIMRVLIKNPGFFYYQGYHDICITFLLILGDETAFHVIDSISRTHLFIFMEKTMDKTNDIMDFILIIIAKESPELGEFLYKSGVGTIFALSWVITWFSHIIENFLLVGRLFDLFLASPPLLPIYLTSAIVLHQKEEILNLDCDMATVHVYLSKILNDEDSLPFEDLIFKANELYSSYSFDELYAIQSRDKKHQKLVKKRRKPSTIGSLINLFKSRSKYAFFSILIVLCAIVYQKYYK